MQLFRKDKQLAGSWDLIRLSIKLLKEDVWPIFYLSFLPSLVTIIGLVLMGTPEKQYSTMMQWDGRALTGLAVAVIGGLATLIAYPGLVYLQTRAVQGDHPTAAELLIY